MFHTLVLTVAADKVGEQDVGLGPQKGSWSGSGLPACSVFLFNGVAGMPAGLTVRNSILGGVLTAAANNRVLLS
jgi:hypothetical protein